jgi:hypothetical protein
MDIAIDGTNRQIVAFVTSAAKSDYFNRGNRLNDLLHLGAEVLK